MSSETLAGNNSHYPDNEAVAINTAADLLAVASEGKGDEVVGILEMKLELIQVGDLNGDSVLHLLACGGYVKALQQLLKFVESKNPELLKEVARQGNAHGDTPLHLAVKNNHWKMVTLLVEVEQESRNIKNDDGKYPENLLGHQGECHFIEKDLSDEKEAKLKLLFGVLRLFQKFNDSGGYRNEEIGVVDIDLSMKLSTMNDEKLLAMLEVDQNLIPAKNWRGQTILQELARSGNFDKLIKLVEHLVTKSRTTRRDHQLPTLNFLLEGDKDGCTLLHQAIDKRNMKASHYLIDVAPEAVYQVNNNGESPLYMAIKEGHDELVKRMLQVMPEASMSTATQRSSNKFLLPHAAIKLRKLATLKVILESKPSFIDVPDEKGWKPLSYAAYKGYLDEVDYLLNKFPESVEKFDSDGTLPIHKAVSGGHVCIIKAFISIHPQTLNSIDMKRRNVLHIAVQYRKGDILNYLTNEVKGVEALYNLRDKDGKTYADYA